MQVQLIKHLEQLAPYADDWDRLAMDVPFRSWTWLSHWWKSYGSTDRHGKRSELSVLAVFDERKSLIGIAPWYSDHSITHGRVLRMLGTGEVCSDYLSLLCLHDTEEAISQAVADFLLEGSVDPGERLRWDLLELSSVDFEDPAVSQLAEHLAERGCTVHRRSGLNCWRLDLPATWEEYLEILSKSYRRQVRRLERDYFEKGRAVFRIVERLDDLTAAMDLLIDMHQRRRHSLGEPGCFSSPWFTAFYRGVLPQMMRQGQLQFFLLEFDGRPVAVEYDLTGGGVLYAYQAGVEPDAMEHQPGKLLTLAIIRWAIEQGYRALDFLRGDEPYKAHFRAVPRPSLEIRIVPDRATARLRHNFWLAGCQVKQWIKRGARGQRREVRGEGRGSETLKG
ncbi:MAG TPA: GNAT family N-acetyltransferase [Thermoguttaceae bacterium]